MSKLKNLNILYTHQGMIDLGEDILSARYEILCIFDEDKMWNGYLESMPNKIFNSFDDLSKQAYEMLETLSMKKIRLISLQDYNLIFEQGGDKKEFCEQLFKSGEEFVNEKNKSFLDNAISNLRSIFKS